MAADDVLTLEGMRFFARHGDLPAERELGGRIEVDVELRCDVADAATSDKLADTIDYAALYERIRETVEGTQYHLLEALAERVAQVVLEDQRVTAARVRVAKQPPLPGVFERFAVTIDRMREEEA